MRIYLIIYRDLTNLLFNNFRYFYLYRISYMYAGVIGFLVTVLVGYIASWILVLLKKQGAEKIYVDGNKNLIKTELFFPIVARHFKNQSAKYLENINVNGNNLNGENLDNNVKENSTSF